MKNLTIAGFLNMTFYVLPFLVITFFTASVSAQSKSIEQYLKAAADYYSDLQFDKALSELEKAEKIQPKNAEIYWQRALIYQLTDKTDNDKAIANLTRVIELNPKSARAYFLRAQIYEMESKFEEAVRDYTKTIKLNPKKAEAYYRRGNLFGQLTKYKHKAIADLTKAIRLRPDSFTYYEARGLKYFEQENYDPAIADFTAQIALIEKTKFLRAEHQKKFLEFPLEYRGRAFWLKKDFEKALSDFSKLIEISPRNIKAFSLRSSIYLELGKPELSLADAMKVQELEKEKQRPD
ncbi:MAG: tetratricopeptide repeat protein [Acidobacteria bacterium]|nr:tetratricopeptide repeat protein [Acidobacteriota bacterium]